MRKEEPDRVGIGPSDGGAGLPFRTEPLFSRPRWPSGRSGQQPVARPDIEVDDLSSAVGPALASGAARGGGVPEERRRGMTGEDVAGPFADETRVRVFAVVALGATSATEAVERTGLPAEEVLLALRRLEEREAVAANADGLVVSCDSFRRPAREAAGRRTTAPGTSGSRR